MKRLYRDKSNEMIAGVCSGIAEYLDVDPTIIRLVFVLFTFLGGGGLWIYLVLWIIMPEKPVVISEVVEIEEKSGQTEPKIETQQAPSEKTTPKKAPAKKPASQPKEAVKKTAEPKKKKTIAKGEETQKE